MQKTQLFPYGTPVWGHELIGRASEMRRVLQDVRGGQHLLLPGPRRIGKSSVVLECLRVLQKESYHTAYIDLMGVNSLRDLAHAIVTAIVASENKKLRKLMRVVTTSLKDLLKFKEFKIAYHDLEIGVLRDINTSARDALQFSLEFIGRYAQKYAQSIICAFDEFGEVARLDPELTRLMRSAFQRQKHCTYIFLGSQESILHQMFSHPKQPFFGFTKEIHLPVTLEIEPFATYIEARFQSAKIKITRQSAELLCQWTFAHPFYTKVFANHVYEYVAMCDLRVIDEQVLDQAYRKAFLALKSDMERQWLDLEPGITRRVCCWMAHPLNTAGIFSKEGLLGEFDSPRIAQVLRMLESKGILQKEAAGKYHFINPFLREYIYSLYEPGYLEDELLPQ